MFSLFKSPLRSLGRWYSSTYECHKKPGRLYVYINRNNDFYRYKFDDFTRYCTRIEHDGYRYVYIYDFETKDDRTDFIRRFYYWNQFHK